MRTKSFTVSFTFDCFKTHTLTHSFFFFSCSMLLEYGIYFWIVSLYNPIQKKLQRTLYTIVHTSTAIKMTISSRYDEQQEPPNSLVKLAKAHKMLTLSSPSQGKDLVKEVFEAIRTIPSCVSMLRSTIVFVASYLRARQTVTQTKSG